MNKIKVFISSLKEKITVKQLIGYIITFICFIFCIAIAVEAISASTKNRPPRFFGISISYVPTASMEPTIMAGEYIMFTKTSFEDVENGDIIVYKSSRDMYIVHRIVQVHDEYLITKGDNNLYQDNEKIYPNMVYGKYVTTVGILSIFSGGINKGVVFFLLMMVLVVMIGMQVASIVIKSKTEEINKNAEEEKKKMLDELRMEILQEELEKQKNNENEDA